MCRAAARFVAWLDTEHRLAFLPMADPAVSGLLPGQSRAEIEAGSHLVLTDGTDLTAGAAYIAVAERLRPVRYAGSFLRALRATPVLDLVDAFFRKTRHRLWWMVPDTEPIRRYP